MPNESLPDLYSSTDSLSTILATVIVAPICLATFILNALALFMICKSKKLRENRFYRLILYLSVSDIIASISSILLIANLSLSLQNVKIPVICFGSTLVMSFTITFSLLQIFFICVERLLATFPSIRYKNWSSSYTIGFFVAFVCTFLYTSSIHILYGNVHATSCQMSDIFGDQMGRFQLGIGVLHFVLFFVIVSIYTVIFSRLKSKQRLVVPIIAVQENPTAVRKKSTSKTYNSQLSNCSAVSDLPITEHPGVPQRQNSSLQQTEKYRDAFRTLGIIIGVMIVSDFVPVAFHLISAMNGDIVSPNILKFTNGLFLINPLCDPIIYILRIKELRDVIACKCCKN